MPGVVWAGDAGDGAEIGLGPLGLGWYMAAEEAGGGGYRGMEVDEVDEMYEMDEVDEVDGGR